MSYYIMVNPISAPYYKIKIEIFWKFIKFNFFLHIWLFIIKTMKAIWHSILYIINLYIILQNHLLFLLLFPLVINI